MSTEEYNISYVAVSVTDDAYETFHVEILSTIADEE